MAELNGLINSAVPAAYLGRTEGRVAKSSNDLIVPALTAFIEGREYNIAQTTISPDLPSRTVITTSGAAISYPAQPQHLAKLNVAVANGSGGAVAGNVVIDGTDERGAVLQDTVTIASVANGGNSNTVSSKYFATITGASLTSTLGNSGNVITVTEYQFRGHVKASASGLAIDWDNTFVTGETKVCSFEMLSTGVLSVQDWREVGPLNKAQRMGTDIVDWSGGSVDGLYDTWLGTCVYDGCELLDGNVLLVGNSAQATEWDGERFVRTFTVGDLSGTDNILCVVAAGLNSQSHEIVWFGTSTGKIVRWDRTADVFVSQTLGGSWSSGKIVNRLVKGSTRNQLYAAGQTRSLMSITDNGASTPSFSGVGGNSGFPSGDDIFDAVYFDRHLFLAGGGGTYMRFVRYDTRMGGTFGGHDLTEYLPGTTRARGRTSTATSNQINGIAVNPDGKIMLAGYSGLGGFYAAEWDTKRQFAEGRVTFTASGASTIPAGFQIGDGTRTYRTIEPTGTAGAGTVSVRVRAEQVGDAGFAAVSTVTTLVGSASNVTAVTNPEPMGMGRALTDRDLDDYELYGLISNTPLGVFWDGSGWVFTMQGGDIIKHDGIAFRSLTPQVLFKGRACRGFRGSRASWVFGDEGRAFSLPH
jgi:hypothetical protein